MSDDQSLLADDDTLDVTLNLYNGLTGVLREVVIMPVESGLGGPIILIEVSWPDPNSDTPNIAVTSNLEFDELTEAIGALGEILDAHGDRFRAGLADPKVIDGEVVTDEPAEPTT